MTRGRVPDPAGPIAPRGPTATSQPTPPTIDAAAAGVAAHEFASDTSESTWQDGRPRIDFATGRLLPDRPEPASPRPQPRIDFATGRLLPDRPALAQPRPQPRIDFATGRLLPDRPAPAQPRPQPRIDFATGRLLPDNAAPVTTGAAVQRQAEPAHSAALTPSEVHATAAAGIRHSGAPLPHADRIQRAFGPDHDLSRVTAHVGGAAAVAAAQLGASAYAVGEHVAFASPPDLRLAAHEAAHVVQQRSGVQLHGGIDQPGDAYERHADAVAKAVVDGKVAGSLLEQLPLGGAYRSPAHPTSGMNWRAIQRTPVTSSDAARSPGIGSPQTSSIARQLATDEQHELSIALQESLRLEAGGAPSVERYSDLLAAVLVAQRLTDRAPNDPAISVRVTQLLQPVSHRLDQLNDHQGRLRQFGAGNLAGQVALDMAQAAIESWLRRLKLGARIHTEEFVIKFRASAETLRFLTGERVDAPTLRTLDAAGRVTALGAAGLALAPVMVAIAAEAAPLLANAAAIATRRVVLWALHNPAAALAASEALLGIGVQLGEDGWETFWNQLNDPRGRWFIIAQVLMDYMHIKSGTHGGGTTAPSPRRSLASTGTELPPSRIPAQETAAPRSGAAPEVDAARERVTRLRAIVQRVHEDASAARETDRAAAPPHPLHSHGEHTAITGATSEPHAVARGGSTHNEIAQARGSLAANTTRTAPAPPTPARTVEETRGPTPANASRTRELGLRPQAVRAIASLENIKKDPVGEVNRDPTHNHYKAARREAKGEVVARRRDGRPFSHIHDLQEHYQGLENVRKILSAEIEVPPPTMTERGTEVLLTKYGEVQSALSRLKGFLDGIGHGPPYPPFHEWPPGS